MQLEMNPVSRWFSPEQALQLVEGGATGLFVSETSKNNFQGDTNYQNICCVWS